MKKPTKIAIIALSATAAVAVAVLTVALIRPKHPTQASASAPEQTCSSSSVPSTGLSSTPNTGLSSAPTAGTQQETTSPLSDPAPESNPRPADPVGNTTATSGEASDTEEIQLPYAVTEQFSVPDTDVFVFPEFAREIYTDEATGKRLPYRLYVPEDYDKTKQYPMFFFLHGAGERGSNNETHIQYLAKSFQVAGDLLSGAIILAPQCPSDGWWDLDTSDGNDCGWLGAAMRLLRTTMAQYRCDKSRVYVAGLSMGGYATWSLLERYGDIFAAGVPICGWGNSAMAAELAKIPIWVYHGTDDPTVSYNCSLEMVDAIKNAGGHMVHLIPLNGVGHNAWDTALGTRKTFLWMFGQTKPKGLAGDDSYTASGLFRLISPRGVVVLTEADIQNVGGQYIDGRSHLVADLTPEAGERLRKAYAADVGQEFTVEYLGHPYYRFRPTSIPQEDQFVFALFAKERFRTLLQKI